MVDGDNSLRDMDRDQLLEIIYDLQLREQDLAARCDDMAQQLNARQIRMGNAGSIAEASLALSGVFESAQFAADEYVRSVRAMMDDAYRASLDAADAAEAHAAQVVQQARHDADEIVDAANGEAVRIVSEAESESNRILGEANSLASKVVLRAQSNAQAILDHAEEMATKTRLLAEDQAVSAQKAQEAPTKAASQAADPMLGASEAHDAVKAFDASPKAKAPATPETIAVPMKGDEVEEDKAEPFGDPVPDVPSAGASTESDSHASALPKASDPMPGLEASEGDSGTLGSDPEESIGIQRLTAVEGGSRVVPAQFEPRETLLQMVTRVTASKRSELGAHAHRSVVSRALEGLDLLKAQAKSKADSGSETVREDGGAAVGGIVEEAAQDAESAPPSSEPSEREATA